MHRIARLFVNKRRTETVIQIQGRNAKGTPYTWDNFSLGKGHIKGTLAGDALLKRLEGHIQDRS